MYKLPGVPKKVVRLINNKTTGFCSIFKLFKLLDRLDPNLDFDISFYSPLQIGPKLTELGELQDKNAVNHETIEIF